MLTTTESEQHVTGGENPRELLAVDTMLECALQTNGEAPEMGLSLTAARRALAPKVEGFRMSDRDNEQWDCAVCRPSRSLRRTIQCRSYKLTVLGDTEVLEVDGLHVALKCTDMACVCLRKSHSSDQPSKPASEECPRHVFRGAGFGQSITWKECGCRRAVSTVKRPCCS